MARAVGSVRRARVEIALLPDHRTGELQRHAILRGMIRNALLNLRGRRDGG
jgi:hypothetical protein